ncbi:putative protein [Hepatitis E virus rat/R63/DEU/2009]|uniref:Uncharacterized protein n=1 Tax=Hepatitis E virus rat/R63/DEU/2009 TaxID=879096 RepID=E0XL24_9VIRU|nr:putative protein [Hepatitis E virus rat/R63/DEU/2009]ADM35753.1 putative protein [Hepatitis E virus rat/R63/DEU/2009]
MVRCYTRRHIPALYTINCHLWARSVFGSRAQPRPATHIITTPLTLIVCGSGGMGPLKVIFMFLPILLCWVLGLLISPDWELSAPARLSRRQ